MNRRAFLGGTGLAIAGSLGGCLSVELFEESPVDFVLWNRSKDAHTVDVTIQSEAGETVLEETFEISGPYEGMTPGGPVIHVRGFTTASRDEYFDLVAVLDGKLTYENQYQATCVTRETRDSFHVEIESGRETYLSSVQSNCR